MRLITKFENVSFFDANLTTIALVKDRTSVELLTKNFEAILFENIGESLQEIYLAKSFTWTNTANEGEGILIKEGGALRKPYLIKSINDKDEIYYRLNNQGSKIDKEEKILWQLNHKFFVYLVSESFFFYKLNKEQLRALDDSSGYVLWDFNCSGENHAYYIKSNYENTPAELHNAEILRIVGVYKGILWIVLKNGRLLGLDVKTGKVIYDLLFPNKLPAAYRVETDSYFYPGVFHQLDRENGKIFGLYQHYYWDIDLADPTTTFIMYNLSASFASHKITADMPGYEWPVQGNEICFGDIHDSARHDNLNNIGLFNRSKREVVFSTRLGEKVSWQPILQKIEFTGDRIYALDGTGILHILEKE